MRGKSECSACHSPARNRTNCLEGTEIVQGAPCAGPCLPGAKQGLSLKLPARGVSVCTCLVLVCWVLCWLGDLTLAHSASEVSWQTRSSFPWFCNKQQEQDCSQPAKLAVMASPSSCSSKLSGGPEKGMEAQVSELVHLPLNLLGLSSSHSLLLIPRSSLVRRLDNVSVLWLCHVLSFECCQVLNFLDFWQ